MRALLRKLIACFLHFITLLIDPLQWDDIQFFAQLARACLVTMWFQQDIWFQQDGATWHTARITIDLLRGEFDEHFILYSRAISWQPRSCDLTPLDYFLCRYVKAHVYVDKPASNDALENNIEAFIGEISIEKLERVCQNWTKWIDHFWDVVVVNICMK